ncbi:hypothetical protein [Mesorhizobium sp. WSM4313]|uniref:hypothetical protein n=1 Tax=Mesorhizobium sp. WSM4313 TaxID=2029412 RepID=UPI000BAFF850|nr:hypothetical protein [Mesorhizobium sp. WSM4313]PBB20550.1 hypothetical protein CK219_05275 [Mesorhizobium sp. WSM4313]
MKTYEVEIMNGEEVTGRQTAIAETPLDAARLVTGRDVDERRGEMEWVRVTDEAEAAVSWFAFK